MIQHCAPDLIGFQELMTANRVTYDQCLPTYKYFLGLRTNRLDRVFFNAIYWRAERLDVLACGGFYLSPTSAEWSLGWDSGRVRAATWVRFRCGLGGGEILHLNTHLDHLGQEARHQGVCLIAAFARKQATGETLVIVSGDFNSLPVAGLSGGGSPSPYAALEKVGLVDCYLAAGERVPGPVHTFHGFRGDEQPLADQAAEAQELVRQGGPNLSFVDGGKGAGQRPLRLDWVMLLTAGRPACVSRYEVATLHQDSAYPSDHYPVVVDLKW